MTNGLWSDVGFQAAARVAVRDCLAVKPGETVLVVTDEPLRDIGELLWEASKEAGAEAVLCEIIPRREHAEEPPAVVAEAMKRSQVVFCPTSKSLSHTQARHEACLAGARIATLPNIRKETFLRALAADYAAIARRSERVADILTQRHEVHLTTAAGTDLIFSLEGREAKSDTGLCHAPGTSSNLPAGEAFIAPVEGTANGVVVVDGTMLGTKLASEPVRLVFRDGIAVEIEGGEVAARLRALVERLGKDAANLAELGVGTNEKAELCGSTLEDEKVLGTVHLALGDNSTFGGKVRVASHQDGILLRPTLVVDGLEVLENGKLLVEGE
jgi:leucyl aminopeptidase (aminopeptidase T)